MSLERAEAGLTVASVRFEHRENALAVGTSEQAPVRGHLPYGPHPEALAPG